MDNKNIDNFNNSKLIKTILNILSSVNKKNSHNSEEEYDESTYPQIQYLFPVEYEKNQSTFDFSGNNQTDLQNSLMSQLSTPFLYICFMLIIYAIIVIVVLVSAVYSHRKKTGYHYEEDSSEYTDDSESSDETSLTNSSVKYSKLQTSNDQDYNQLRPKSNRSTHDLEISDQVTVNKAKKFKTSRIKRIKNKLKCRKFDLKTQKHLARYFSIRNNMNNQLDDSIKKPMNYLRKLIGKTSYNSKKSYATYQKAHELVKIENLIDLNSKKNNIHNSNEQLSYKSFDAILI
jgi:hypothetical protein